MNRNRIVIDQTKIRVSDEAAPPFPHPLDWWQRYVPCWLTVSEDEQGRLVLTPNGHRADGFACEPTQAAVRRDLKAVTRWLDGNLVLDFTHAIVTD